MQSVPDAELTALSRYVLTGPANEQMRVTITDVAERRAGGSTAALVIAVRHGVHARARVVSRSKDT